MRLPPQPSGRFRRACLDGGQQRTQPRIADAGGWTAHKIAVTQAAVEAFTLAASAVIPSLVSITNRAEAQVLNATNFMGIHTPAIIERDVEYYGEHWPHNSSAGWAYASVLSTLSAALALPPPAARWAPHRRHRQQPARPWRKPRDRVG